MQIPSNEIYTLHTWQGVERRYCCKCCLIEVLDRKEASSEDPDFRLCVSCTSAEDPASRFPSSRSFFKFAIIGLWKKKKSNNFD